MKNKTIYFTKEEKEKVKKKMQECELHSAGHILEQNKNKKTKEKQ